MIGQAPQKLKGKMARMVATKAALSIRVDALSDADSRSEPSAAEIGVTNRVKLESRLRALEHRAGIQSVRRVTSGVNMRQQPRFEMNGASSYNAASDSVPVNGLLATQPNGSSKGMQAVVDVKQEKRAIKEELREERRKEKKKRKSEASEANGDVTMESIASNGGPHEETKDERRARKEAKRAVSCWT